MEFVYPVSNYLQSLTLRAFADWQVTGRENVPPLGPLIIVANHQSNIDPPLLSTSIPRRITFLAKKGIFKGPVASWYLRSYGAFPLDREGFDIRAYRWALSQLERSQAIVIFPEGTRSRGGMKKARPGVAKLALMTQASLLPVGITGTARLGSILRVFNPTGKIRVNIGMPFSIPTIEGKPGDEVVNSLADMIMQRVALQLPATHQGVYRIKARQAAAMDDGGSSPST
jgi:1-acyl-sn-glycerol-3-phosphate acyltransferase